MDVGLVIARYGDSLEQVSHGVCVAGQAGSHHHCSFRLIVFRPFVEEVCLGKVLRSTNEGIYVSLGFFEDIFIPAYWMLKPSAFDEKTGLWFWRPSDDDDDDDNDDNNEGKAKARQDTEQNGKASETDLAASSVKSEPNDEARPEQTEETEDSEFFQMEIGAEIRFKVKSIHFARITNSAKGRQAVLSTTDKPWARRDKRTKPDTSPSSEINNNANSSSGSNNNGDEPKMTPPPARPVRQRSSSVGLDDETELPPTMHIVASICEDGLGLARWWDGAEEDEGGEEPAEEEGD